MRRIDKYPETKWFKYFNANPKNRITTDCVCRALARAIGVRYEDVVMELARFQIETGYDSSGVEGYGRWLEKNGWKKMKQPRKADGKKFTGREFCDLLQTAMQIPDSLMIRDPGRVIANIGGNHVVAIIDGKINDIWDSSDGCIGNYWVRK